MISALVSVDADVGRAVVRLSQPISPRVVRQPPAELTNYGNSAVIVVKPARSLERIPGVRLVPLPDGRALISLEDGMRASDFEVKVRDLLEEGVGIDPAERSVLTSIVQILKTARHTRGMTVRQRSIIVLQSTRRRIARA